MALRCVYTDLDGTLLGAGASLFRDGAGGFTLLPARALEACHRAGVEVVLKSGRRKEQVMEDARLIGQSAYIYEIGSGLVIDGEEHFLCGPYAPRDGLSPHDLIGDAGAPALLERSFGDAIEPHAPWHLDRYVSHLYRGTLDVGEANALLEREGHGDLRLVDNGEIEDGRSVYHLVPSVASKAAAVQFHMTARGYEPEQCIAVGDSLEDLGVAEVVGRFFMVANGPEASGANVERTESSHGEGFYEAVVRSLMGG
jgi:hydroxymethylpyrimidine pyrophosphatase-like HAD family hydrolase